MGRSLPHLPHELIFNILSRLPVKSLCRFKSVSKPWLALITDTDFIKSHLHQSIKYNMNQKLILAFQASRMFYSLDYQAPALAELVLPFRPNLKLKLMASLNGVLLLVGTGKTLWLWNPSIRMSQRFSQPKKPDGYVMYGLGYDSVSDDLKVVRAITPDRKNARSAIHVFSSRLSSWKRIEDFGYKIRFWTRSAVLNGAPHWIVGRLGSGIGDVIVYFDATEEKFNEVPSPDCEGENILVDWRMDHLGVLGGSLCLVKKDLGSHADVWVMKEYGVKESWTKLFVVPGMPLCHANDGEVVMRLFSKKLVRFNWKENSYKTIIDLVYLEYVESLVSPQGGK